MTDLRLVAVNRPLDWGTHLRPTRALIDLGAVIGNARILAERGQCDLFAVVKADAYGHGAIPVSLALESASRAGWPGLRGLAVSLVEEGIELRAAGVTVPILVMGPSLMDAHDLLLEHDLTPMISDARHIVPLHRAAKKRGKLLGIHLMVDTGMGRLGLLPAALPSVMDEIDAHSSLHLLGIASHLACADLDDPDDPQSHSAHQLRRFREVEQQCRVRTSNGLSFHVANSAGLLRLSEARTGLARPGIALYGNGSLPKVGLVQVMQLVSEVSQVRRLRLGESVSYGARWTAQRDSVLAIVPVGYADGLPRNYNQSGTGVVLIGGERCAIAGTVSMDMIVIDITDCPQARLSDEVVVLGHQGTQSIGVTEVALRSDISEYEVTCGISKRVPRTYTSQNG